MNKFFKTIFLTIFLSFMLAPALIPTTVGAQTVDEGTSSGSESRVLNRMKSVAGFGGFDTGEEAASVPRIVGMIINGILSIIGLVFLILTVFAGFNWMTSQGNDEKIKKSMDTLKSSVIGLIVTLSAWTIWNFIFVNLIL